VRSSKIVRFDARPVDEIAQPSTLTCGALIVAFGTGMDIVGVGGTVSPTSRFVVPRSFSSPSSKVETRIWYVPTLAGKKGT
jgi:hypothetical protein